VKCELPLHWVSRDFLGVRLFFSPARRNFTPSFGICLCLGLTSSVNGFITSCRFSFGFQCQGPPCGMLDANPNAKTERRAIFTVYKLFRGGRLLLLASLFFNGCGSPHWLQYTIFHKIPSPRCLHSSKFFPFTIPARCDALTHLKPFALPLLPKLRSKHPQTKNVLGH